MTEVPTERRISSEAGLVARGSALNIIAMTLGYVLAFALTVVVSRWLRPREAGVFFELIALFMILNNTLELGADTGLTRWISRAEAVGELGDVRRIVVIALAPVVVFGVVASAVVWAVAPQLAHVFFHHAPSAASAAGDLRFVAPFIPLSALSACILAGARGFGRMWPYLAIEGFGKPVMRLGLVLGAVAGGWGLFGAVIGWSVPVALGLGIALLILLRIIATETAEKGHEPSSRPRRQLAGEFWRFAGPRGFAGVFQVVVTWLGILLVGARLSTYDAGVYGAVSRLAMLGTFALEGTRLAISPYLSALLARRQMTAAADLFQSATRWLMLASWPLYVVFAIFPSVALEIFGHRYEGGAAALVVLSVAMLVNVGTGNVTVVLLMGGKSSWNVLNTLSALLVNVVLNLVLLPHIGIVGAAVALGASIIVDNVAAVVEVWWVLHLSPFGPGYALVAGAAAGCFGVTGLVARLVLGETLPAAAAAVAAGLAVYVVVAYRTRSRLQLDELVTALRRGGVTSPAPKPGAKMEGRMA
ncbi:MAG: polysaccharide biosynthesis C-terminal domain-containing protein [Acidimicrobiales bacterium]